MRAVLKIINLFALLFMCVGCSVKREDTLRVNIGADPHTLDPRKARDLQSLTLAKMFFEGLTRINPEEKAELAMAEKVDVSSDGKTYTFTLRPAKWSDGTAVTAQDFVYAWKKVLAAHFPADQAFQLYVIKNGKAAKEGKVGLDQVGVQALDAQTLRVELQNPVPYFLELTALPIFFPALQKTDDSDLEKASKGAGLIGNGPFLLKEWRHNDILRVVKNPSYWDVDHVGLNALDLLMVSEETELRMFEKGELDWAGSPLSTLPVGSLAALKKSGSLHAKPFLATYFFRTNVGAEPFQNPLMRRAFALALKRSELVEHVTQGGQLPATGLLPPSLTMQQAPYFSDGDTLGARRLFEQALEALDMKQESLPSISLMYITGERNHLIAQAAQEQWRSVLGIAVELQAVERKVFYDRVSKKNFQLAAGSWTADYNDGLNFLEVFKFKASGSNNTAWEDPQYQELLDRAMQLQDTDERQRIFHTCESILIGQMPIIPLFHYTLLYAVNKKVKGVVLSSLGSIDFKWASIEKERS